MAVAKVPNQRRFHLGKSKQKANLSEAVSNNIIECSGIDRITDVDYVEAKLHVIMVKLSVRNIWACTANIIGIDETTNISTIWIFFKGSKYMKLDISRD